MIETTLPGLLPPAKSEVIELEVPCVPKGQPRLRHSLMRKKTGEAFVRSYTPDTADAFKDMIKLKAARYRDRLHAGPVRIDVVAYFPRTEKTWRKDRLGIKRLIEVNHLPPDAPAEAVRMWCKPDRDNVDKAILDALGDIKLFACGDEQVCAGGIEKWWTAKGSPPGVRIRIELMPLPEWAARKQAKAKKRRS